MDDDEETKKRYHELISFATEGMNENAQFIVAIAIAI
jgi:hypothetical protein